MRQGIPFRSPLQRLVRLNVRAQIWIAFIALLAMYVVALEISSRYLTATENVTRHDLESISASMGMINAVDTIADASAELDQNPDASQWARVDEASKAFDRAMAVQVQHMTAAGEPALTQKIQGLWENLNQSIAAERTAASSRPVQMWQQISPTVHDLRLAINQLSDMNSGAIKSTNEALINSAEGTRAILHVAFVAGLVGTVIFVMMIGRRIVKPLDEMTDAAERISLGFLDQSLSISSRDEFGRLARAFNRMIVELRRLRALDADRIQRAYLSVQAAIDSLPDGVITLSEHSKVELANETARRLFGIAAGQDDLATRLPASVDLIKPTASQPVGYESSIELNDNGVVRAFLPKSVPLTDATGRTIGSTLILADVTSFRRLDQLKDSLLSTASHELKTPLTSMRMIFPLLLEQGIGPLNAKQVELITVTRDAAERLRHIVDTILDLGRLSSGKLPMEWRPMRPGDLIFRSAQAYAASYAARGIELAVETPSELAPVQCDAGRIEHVFSNLLDNALRHTLPGGKVIVSARQLGVFVRFDVRDTGCGIAPGHISRVFETFYRVPGQRSDTGSGLGLALVKQIVEWHGGKVGVESTVNVGSTFWFTLPIAGAGGKSEKNDKQHDRAKQSTADGGSVATAV
jgi:two-component system, NtrC family, sensor histidine kinase KinB